MPPSGRKGKTRARKPAEPQEPSDAETPEAIATPTRSSRKRARDSEAAAAPVARARRRKTKDTRAADREDTEGTEAQEPSDNETEPTGPTEQDILQHLKVSGDQCNAVDDYSNDLLEGQENVPGFGKIAGRNWAYIIRKVQVNIGRPEAREKMTYDENGEPRNLSSKTLVDIDLGPERQVSRSHAIIEYDGDNEKWFILVNGRNGLRVDNNLIKRGMRVYLRNGSVIEIANTQMAFITTAAEDGQGPIWDASIIKQAQKSSEDDDDAEYDARTNGNNRQHGAAGGRSQLTEPSAYSAAGGDYNGNQQHRTHPHSQRAMQMAPGTPMRSTQSMMKSSPAANYARGVMMESTESIDYASDNAKDLKPPHSYAQLIGMAILSTQEQQMTLNNIYKWIMANYAFYRFNTGGWQNSIRHNLSLNKAFTKIARRTDEPGKGMKWMIEPAEFDTFVQQGMKGCRRPGPALASSVMGLGATQSTFGSPSSPVRPLRGPPGSAGTGHGKLEQEDLTPPMHTFQPLYPTAQEAYTPDRGSKRQVDGARVGLGINSNDADYDYLTRSSPRNGLTAAANAAGSPPSLYVSEDGRVGPLDTPFPMRPSQRFAPPSTLKRPSDFIQFSSPAPFWKMEGLVGSTPFKPYDLSPLKTPFSNLKKMEREEDEKKEETVVGEGDDEEEAKEGDGAKRDEKTNSRGSPVIQSSSPPMRSHSGPAFEPLSPTLSRPATAVAKTLSQMAQANVNADADRELVAKQLANELPLAREERSATLPPPPSAGSSSGASVPPHHAPTAPSLEPAVQLNGLGGLKTGINGINGYYPSSQPTHNGNYALASGPATNGFHVDDGEDEGIDLAKGFQPIGAFHQRNHIGVGMGVAGGAPGYGR